MAKKVTVKLSDTGSIFHDISQSETIIGKDSVEFKRTSKVNQAIKSGVLIEVKGSTKPKESSLESKKDSDKGKYSDFVKSELKDLLDEREIEYSDKATNIELISLLEDSDKDKAPSEDSDK